MDAYREKQLMDRIKALEERLDAMSWNTTSPFITTTGANTYPNYTQTFTPSNVTIV